MTSAGSSLKFCLVATGEADLYPRLGRTMEWDTAAGDAVLRGAGGEVVRFDDHTPLTYGKPGPKPVLHRLCPRRSAPAGPAHVVVIVIPPATPRPAIRAPLVELRGASGQGLSLIRRSWEAARPRRASTA